MPVPLPEPALEPRAEPKQNRFHMFARAQAIDPEIHAIARKLALIDLADFNRVRQAAAGFDVKIREDRMLRINVRNAKALGQCPRSTAIDLVLVCRPPVMNRRHVNISLSPSLHPRINCFTVKAVKAELLLITHRLFTGPRAKPE